MTTVPKSVIVREQSLELQTGDRMTREEFHNAYEKTPETFRAELIGGTVYVASPLRRRHSLHHIFLAGLFFVYEGNTPGVEPGDNATILLGDDSEPQPDLSLRILPEFGGQSHTTDDDYVEGGPELVAEIAHSSRALDLHAKRDDYTRYGVLEYLVLSVAEQRLRWFDLRARREHPVEPDGVLKIRTFPGLWLNVEAVLTRDFKKAMATLEQGLASPEHAAFVKRLADARSGGGGGPPIDP